MKRILVSLSMVLTAACGVAWSAALPAQADPGARPGAGAKATALRLMPLGDSITYGVGSSTGNGYRSALWDDLSAEGHAPDFVGTMRSGKMSDPDNEGHSGWRIDQIAAIVDASLARYRPNVITLEIGTNDLNQNYQVATATDRLHALVDRIVADAPDATVLVGSLIVSTSVAEEPHRAAFNRAVPGIVRAEQAAGRHVRYVDMGALTSADLNDTLHPDDGGYRKMAAAFNSGVRAADSAGWIKAPVATTGNAVKPAVAEKSTAKGSSTAKGAGTVKGSATCLSATVFGAANGSKPYNCDGTAARNWSALQPV